MASVWRAFDDGARFGVLQSGIRCDDCGLEAIANPLIEQPVFHVFTDGVLCDDCYRKALNGQQR